MAISTLMTLAAAVLSGAGQPDAALPDWLAGDWICREEMLAGGPLVRSETWARDDWSGLTGVARGGLARAGSTLSELSLARIIDLGEGLTMSYSAGSGPVLEFRTVETGDGVIVFETGDDRAPQRIAYRRGPFTLTVTHSRRDGGEAQSWRYARAGIHTGMPDC